MKRTDPNRLLLGRIMAAMIITAMGNTLFLLSVSLFDYQSMLIHQYALNLFFFLSLVPYVEGIR